MMKKRIFIIIAVLFILIIVNLISLASAAQYALVCLRRGETLRFSECNPLIDDRTCGADLGCQYCTIQLDSGVYCPANLNKCYSLGLSCSYLNDPNIDRLPPNLTINSPLNGKVYNLTSILLDIDVNEKSNIFYYNNINGGSWTQVCMGCYEYSKIRIFKEGLNDLTFKASDVLGNTAYKNVSFFIDTKKPKIRGTLPRRGFADGNFAVEFIEQNPSELVLNYGNSQTEYRTEELNIDENCQLNRGKYTCNTNVNLNDYDNQTIEYWFKIVDIANYSDLSKHVTLQVDTTSPVIENDIQLTSLYTINGRYVIFNISVIEQNFDEIIYYDNNDLRPRWKKLCTRLTNGKCVKKTSFVRGNHTLDIQVIDKAGNAVAERINFNIV